MEDKLVIKGIEFKSRLWVGTGKYKDFEETKMAIEATCANPQRAYVAMIADRTWLRVPAERATARSW